MLGVLATAGPVLWFISWLQKQGETEVSITANWAIGLTDLRIDQTIATLNDLAARGVDSCKPAHLDLLRQTLFVSGPVKEFAVIGPNAQVMCTDMGTSFGVRDVIASAATGIPEIMLDVVSASDARRAAAARAPCSLPRASLRWRRRCRPICCCRRSDRTARQFGGIARMTLADGTLLGATGETPALAQPESRIRSSAKSDPNAMGRS